MHPLLISAWLDASHCNINTNKIEGATPSLTDNVVQERAATERERTRREMRQNNFTISTKLTRWVRSCQGTCLFLFASVYCGLIDPQRTQFCQICSISTNIYQAVTRVNPRTNFFKVQGTMTKCTVVLWTPCSSLPLKFILFFFF